MLKTNLFTLQKAYQNSLYKRKIFFELRTMGRGYAKWLVPRVAG